MIDRYAMEKIASAHSGAMSSATGVSLILHLHSGEKYAVNSVAEYHDTYCVVGVYPQKALDPETLDEAVPKDRDGNRIFDRLIIPYTYIAYVALTAIEPEKRGGLGFNA